MSETATAVPPAFAHLLEIDRRARAHAAGLPQQRKAQIPWHGIAFRSAGLPLLADMNEIREVHPYATPTLVPGTKHWVRGVTNIRGALTPVIDLAGFLGKPMRPISGRSRLLVLNHPILSAALLVDELAGLRHFAVDDLRNTDDSAPLDDALRGFAQGYYDYREQSWTVFSMQHLIKDPHFLNVAA